MKDKKIMDAGYWMLVLKVVQHFESIGYLSGKGYAVHLFHLDQKAQECDATEV
jgi:hypothetical protein